jgi:hypothetical protein
MPRVWSIVAVGGALAFCCACGGRAAEREEPTDPLAVPDRNEVEAPVEQLPSLPEPEGANRGVELLQVRRSDEIGAAEVAASGCTTDGHSTAIKVDLQLRRLASASCEVGPDYHGTSGYTTTLLDDELARVEEAYLALRIVTAERCIPADNVFTLELSPEHGEPLLYGDEQHSGCPVAGLERERHVTGLDELFRVLEAIPVR